MKLWDSLTTCLLLLSSVHASPPTQHRRPPSTAARSRAHPSPSERPLETPPVNIRLLIDPAANTPAVRTEPDDPEGMADGEQHAAGVRLAERLAERLASAGVTVGPAPRSASASPSPTPSPSTPSAASRGHLSSRARRRRGKKKAVRVRSTRGGGGGGGGGGGEGGGGGGGGGGGAKEAGRRKGRRGRGGQGCMLKQIHLNVSDLGLGYQSEEELIFRYCAGPCRKSETNYDKILHSIAPSRRLGARDTPPYACCRPIAFDDDLSFLDDNLVYHTIRKHSARKCGCV